MCYVLHVFLVIWVFNEMYPLLMYQLFAHVKSMNFKKFRDAVQQTIIEDRGSKQDGNQDAGL